MLKQLISDLIEQLQVRFKPNLQSIILTGSYSRGDQTNESDIDIFCFFNSLTTRELEDIGHIEKSISASYGVKELDLQCLTVNEYKQYGFQYFVSPLLYFEGQLLYGESIVREPHTGELIEFAERVLTDAIMSLRHYITVREPNEKLADGRLKRWVLKPICIAHRIGRYLDCRYYPLNYKDLLNSIESLSDKRIVSWLLESATLKQDLYNDTSSVLSEISKSTQELLIKIRNHQ